MRCLLPVGGLWTRLTLDGGADVDADVEAGAEFDIAQWLMMM